MKLELWSTCISVRIMLTVCSFVCNRSESFGYYSYNNWLECFKMGSKLVPKNYQNARPHIAAPRRSRRWRYRGKRGDGNQARDWTRAPVRIGPKPLCDGNGMRLDHVPSGQPTSARSAPTGPSGLVMPRPDTNKEDQDTSKEISCSWQHENAPNLQE